MVDQLLGLLLLGLGLKNPMTGQVAGEQTQETRLRSDSFRQGRPQVGKVELKQNIQDDRKEVKNRLTEDREELRSSVNAKREEFKKKISEFKDTHKREVAQRLTTKLGEVNTRRTQKMNDHLTKLQEVFDKLTTRANDLNAKGLNTSSVEEKLTVAKVALEAAKSAVAVQSAKTYTLNVTSESTIKTDMGTAIKGLQNDLKNTFSTVDAAKKALKDAALTLRALSDAPVLTGPVPSVSP